MKQQEVPIKKKRKSIISTIQETIKSQLNKNPFLTTHELSKIIKDNLNTDVSSSTCWRTLRFLNYTRKRACTKIISKKTSELVPPFKEMYKKSDNIVSIDETFFYYDTPRYGYSPKGKRLTKILGKNPKQKKITLYMAISTERIVGYKISLSNGNSKDFTDFLKSLQLHNATLVMDNVAFHKTKEVKDLITSTKSQALFIPPYSPEFNPIELAFSKIKTMYRKLCLINETNKQENVQRSITALTASDLLQFFKHVDTFIDN